MTDVAEAASEQIVDTFALPGCKCSGQTSKRATKVRANFSSITKAMRSTPLDLRGGVYTEQNQKPKQILALWANRILLD
jgi:hypothetical protein